MVGDKICVGNAVAIGKYEILSSSRPTLYLKVSLSESHHARARYDAPGRALHHATFRLFPSWAALTRHR